MSPNVDYGYVARLLRQVPLPPEGEVTQGADQEQVAAIAAQYALPLPYSYIQWLRLCNGSVAGPGGIYGVHTTKDWLDALAALRRNPHWVALGWIPVAGDGNGNAYVMDASRLYMDADAIFFVDSMDGGELSYIAASGLTILLKFLLEKELGEDRGRSMPTMLAMWIRISRASVMRTYCPGSAETFSSMPRVVPARCSVALGMVDGFPPESGGEADHLGS